MACTYIVKNAIICTVVVMVDNQPTITEAGGYVNHAYKANSMLKKTATGYDLVAIRDIEESEEITADYNFTPPFLEKPKASFV